MCACCAISACKPWRHSPKSLTSEASPLPTIDLNASPQLHVVRPATTSQSACMVNATGRRPPAAARIASSLRPCGAEWNQSVSLPGHPTSSAATTPVLPTVSAPFTKTVAATRPSASAYATSTMSQAAIIAAICSGSATSRSARRIIRCSPATVRSSSRLAGLRAPAMFSMLMLLSGPFGAYIQQNATSHAARAVAAYRS